LFFLPIRLPGERLPEAPLRGVNDRFKTISHGDSAGVAARKRLAVMPSTIVKDLVEAGIHFGQKRSAWNPRMKPYIYGTRNRIHIIDVRETIKGILLAKRFVSRLVAHGKDVCFVGTKRQAAPAVEKYARDVGMPFVSERWLGGTLTNFRTIRERLKRLNELENLVETKAIDSYSKKMASQLMREKAKITRNLDGIRNMDKLPGALVIVDVNYEINAVREARNIGVPTIALIDTDGDPGLVDIAIPGNDDSIRSIDVVIREIAEAIKEGKLGRQQAQRGGGGEDGGDQGQPRRRSSRSRFRSDEPASEGAGEGADAGEATQA